MNWSLILKTAIRDSRKDRSKLILFMSSIILGVAALVAINSFNDNLMRDIRLQSKSLLGADIAITGNKPLSEEMNIALDSLGGVVSTEVELFSMSFLPSIGESQFVKIKAIEGGFPYYGNVHTAPKNAYHEYQNGRLALVDDGLLLQYKIDVGDSIKIGDITFKIHGRIMSSFGSIDAGSSFAPTVYIPKKEIQYTGLVQHGSIINYTQYRKIEDEKKIEKWKAKYATLFYDASMRIKTVETQRQNLEKAFRSLNDFLNIVALISLLLACIGVASSVMIYVKTKTQSIAILRCLGMKGEDAFMVYFVQIFVLGTLSVLLGVALGTIIQVALPIVLGSFLPFEVTMSPSVPAMIKGTIMGILITTLFALSPLLQVRNVSPLETLRVSNGKAPYDPLKWLVHLGIFITITGFLWTLTHNIKEALIASGGLLIAFLVLYGVAKSVTWLVRRFFPKNSNYVFRQGLSNLYRPNNQTSTLIVSIGLGTAILTLLFILQGLILNNVSEMGAGKQPNIILFGIEHEQKTEIEDITKSFGMPVLQHVPVVTMELIAWQGKSKKDWLADTSRTANRWSINREARVSYQSEISQGDQLIEGEYTGQYSGDTVWISLDQRYADGLDVGIGDQIIWNVQGAIIETYVGSIRKIDFKKMESRFFILFPIGILEEAPQFLILVTKSPDKETTAAYRNKVVKQMPNISVIDLGSILVTLNSIVSKVSYIIKFMAAFSIIIGLIVLISSLFLSKYQRIRESVLLRTLGAQENTIYKINAVEYALLGTFSALTGISIAIIGSYILAKNVFELDFNLNYLPIIGIFFFIVLLTVIIGLWNSREVVKKSPLEILRRL
ncbi:MAG: FtsX-like permease family protein [Saprospiraceae bacterium]